MLQPAWIRARLRAVKVAALDCAALHATDIMISERRGSAHGVALFTDPSLKEFTARREHATPDRRDRSVSHTPHHRVPVRPTVAELPYHACACAYAYAYAYAMRVDLCRVELS